MVYFWDIYGGVPLCPLTSSVQQPQGLQEDKCFIIQRHLLPGRCCEALALATPDLTCHLGGKPKPLHSSLLGSRMDIVLGSNHFRGSPKLWGTQITSAPGQGQQQPPVVPINLPMEHFRLWLRRIYGEGGTRDNGLPSQAPPADFSHGQLQQGPNGWVRKASSQGCSPPSPQAGGLTHSVTCFFIHCCIFFNECVLLLKSKEERKQ